MGGGDGTVDLEVSGPLARIAITISSEMCHSYCVLLSD